MARTPSALVTPAVLRWAREQIQMPTPVAAKKATVTADKLTAWEEGSAQPTLRQARALAHAYRLPLAAFYLDVPPQSTPHIPKDYRRFAGSQDDGFMSILAVDIKDAWEKREIALELSMLQGSAIPSFVVVANIDSDPEEVGASLRSALRVTLSEQAVWRDPRRAFNTWRGKVADLGALVLQTSDVPLKDLRAYSLFAHTLPVVVLNRKDVPAARTFSLMHELVHLALKSEGICDLTTEVSRAPEEQKLEVFCNATAAAILIPRDALLSHPLVKRHSAAPEWDDEDIVALARHFSTSREALLRRLLTFGRTTDRFYRTKRDQYSREYRNRPPAKAIVLPPADALSLLGRPYVKLVLDNLDSGQITSTDASDYLGVKLKHLTALSAALEAE